MGERPAPAWSRIAIERLRRSDECPVCERRTLAQSRCQVCGSDFAGTAGAELWRASLAAADALDVRQAALDRMRPPPAPAHPDAAGAQAAAHTAAASATSPSAAGTASASAGIAGPQVAPRIAPAPAALLPARSATLQSVLAVAGAGLLGIAAVVFAYASPDISERTTRTAILAIVTAVLAAGALLLARRRLRFSAEAVAALSGVFVVLDIASVAESATAAAGPLVAAAIGSLTAGGVLLGLGVAARIRVWIWSGLVALAVTPMLFGAAGGGWLGTTAGMLCATGAALALVTLTGSLERRTGGWLDVERGTLTVLQFVCVLAAGSQLLRIPFTHPTAMWLTVTAVLSVIALLSLRSAGGGPAGGLWSATLGVSAVAAVGVLPFAIPGVDARWFFALVPAAVAAGLLATTTRPPHRVHRDALLSGALAIVAVAGAAPVSAGLGVIALGLAGHEGMLPPTGEVAVVLGLVLLVAAFIAHPRLARPVVGEPDASAGDERSDDTAGAPVALHPGTESVAHRPGTETEPDATPPAPASAVAGARPASDSSRLAGLGGALAILTVLVTVASSIAPLPWRLALGLLLAVAACLVTLRTVRLTASARGLLVVGAHAVVLLSAVLAWQHAALTVVAGAAVVAVSALLAHTAPASIRFVHAALAYAYSLALLAHALGDAGLGAVPLLCAVTSAGGLVAMATTYLPRVPARTWYAVLAVTGVPFVIGVAQVVFERSGWTALSTGVIFALALTLTGTRRPGVPRVLRVCAAALLVPSLAVVLVCLGAQALATSGSPVVLPVIAVLVALVLPSRFAIRRVLARRIGSPDATAAALAIEGSTLLTAVIAVGLALERDAAGLGTALLVLVLLGIGGFATAIWAGRRYGWWMGAASLTGALWCAWGIAGIAEPEPYLLPPALGAVVVGTVLTARGRPGVPLVATGLAIATLPVLALLAVDGSAHGWRTGGLLGAAWLLALGARLLRDRLTVLRTPVLLAAMLAGAAGALQGMRWGAGLDPAPGTLLAVVGIGLAGAGAAALAAHGFHGERRLSRGRWLWCPAAVYLGVAMWPSITRDWDVIWTMWTLMLAYLVAMLLVTARGARGSTALPPVWVLFVLAFTTAVVAWSPRDLRVEWFSLPLGAFLLTAGAIGLATASGLGTSSGLATASETTARADSIRATLAGWPNGWTGSWPLLGPGLGVLLGASVAATYTDPRTWRAILVIVIALLAILVGSGRRLAAPFLIGVIVLPIENVLAFLVQIGRGIASMPWWITLAVVGAVLLIIAVTYERRTGEDAGIAARLRDLR